MNIISVGLSHKTAPVELREMLVIPDSRIGEALTRLIAYPGVNEGMLLQTCNRVEVYAVVDEAEAGFAMIQEFLVATHLSLSAERLLPHLYWHAGDRAILHLFRVTASLDSMVVGEPQVLGQVKDAFRAALANNASSIILNKLVKKSISVAKRIRTETRIAENAVSVSYAAVELAKKVFSNLSARTVLLVGAGEMAKLAAQHLVNHGVRQVLITTRDAVRARTMADRFHGSALPFTEFRAEMGNADIVICSTGASHYLIGAEDVQRAVRERRNRPMFLIDVSVPRNIDPAVRDVDNAFLFDIDDLEMHVEQNREERRQEAAKAEGIVEEEIDVMLKWLQSLEVTPTIVALRSRAEEIKQSELQKAFGRLGSLSPQDKLMIEGLASSIVNKLLHGSLVTLKSSAQTANGSMFVEAARRFFDLDGGDESVDVSTRDDVNALPSDDGRSMAKGDGDAGEPSQDAPQVSPRTHRT